MQVCKLLQRISTKATTKPLGYFGGVQTKTDFIRFVPTNVNPTSTFTTKSKSVLPSILNAQRNVNPALFLKDANALTGNKVAPKTDNTASVYLENPPPLAEEDKEAASYLGVNHFYRGANNNFYMIQFDPAQDSINDYLEHAKLEFYGKIPYGSISEVELSNDLLGKIEHLLQSHDIECRALFFDKKKQPTDVQRVAELLFIVKTPGGFWNISCHSTYFHLATNKDLLFGTLLKNLRIDLRSKTTSLTPKKMKKSSEDHKDAVLSDGTKLPKKKLTKRKRVTATATIGNLNLVQPTDDLSGTLLSGDELD